MEKGKLGTDDIGTDGDSSKVKLKKGTEPNGCATYRPSFGKNVLVGGKICIGGEGGDQSVFAPVGVRLDTKGDSLLLGEGGKC